MKGDTSLRLGDALSDVPSQRASVCNSYACQASALKGLGWAPASISSAREANLPNTHHLAGYVRTDASLSYRSGGWRPQLDVVNRSDRRYYTGGSASVFNATLDPIRPRAALPVTYRV